MNEFAAADPSLLQFILTTLLRLVFAPLTIGLALLLVIMESVWVMTRRPIWRDMTRFWGQAFGINSAVGILTGVTLELQYTTSWDYLADYVDGALGVPVSLETSVAMAVLVLLIVAFFRGWDRLSAPAHLAVTCAMALGANLVAWWTLVGHAWLQNPVGAVFDPDTLRLEIVSIVEVILNPVAQAKFVHTVSAGYVAGATFVLAVSAAWLLAGRAQAFARRSFTVAASFGLASALSVMVLGDASGYTATASQQMKIAAIQGEWKTHEPPAPFALVGMPSRDLRRNQYELQVPALLGLVTTRSLDEVVPGIKQLVDENVLRINSGLLAHAALERYRADPSDTESRDYAAARHQDLGYAWLLKQYRDDIENASTAEVNMAAWATVPDVPLMFWSFRIMVLLGLALTALFVAAFVISARGRQAHSRGFLWLAVLSLPLPWVASGLGWLVSEYGRQPWAIEGVLPLFMVSEALADGEASSGGADGLFGIGGDLGLLCIVFVALNMGLLLVHVWRGPERRTDDTDTRAARGGG